MDKMLRSIVQANALLSLASGALLAGIPSVVGGWLGVAIDGWLRLLGVGLVGHAAALLWAQASVDLPRWSRLNLIVIAPYPLLMLGLLAFGIVERNVGRALVAADGIVVGCLAVAHWQALFGRRSPKVNVA